MKSQALFFLLLLSCMNLSRAQGSFGNCCLGYVPKMRPNAYKFIETYRLQETDGDCNISAVVFQMKKRRHQTTKKTVCANPNDPLVQFLIKKVNQKRRSAHDKNSQ
ncbi:C-C motif chemokine 25b [Synchiropus splendidus]|uniref:C-C motif chemokine 25b n=1 Tax=Synchiropus splendidus TaxID=270530 RepID=UPI00237DA988|nr:C-C motif chemokine 25b [Synchiropus splendidus]